MNTMYRATIQTDKHTRADMTGWGGEIKALLR